MAKKKCRQLGIDTFIEKTIAVKERVHQILIFLNMTFPFASFLFPKLT